MLTSRSAHQSSASMDRLQISPLILSEWKLKKKTKKKFIKAYKTIVTENNVVLFIFLKLIQVENDGHIVRNNYPIATQKSCSIWIIFF